MPEGRAWHVRNLHEAWGTEETVSAVIRGLNLVANAIPDTQRVEIGDLSARHGGRLRPHRSHQSGRDIDVAYYRFDGNELTTFTSTARVDAARQWLLFRHWIARGEVTYIFVDRVIMRQLEMYAAAHEPDPAVYRAAFGDNGDDGVIRYARGHSNHFHARFVCPASDSHCSDT
jgi:penicillin-insensitive murein endopeptidase